MKLKEIKELTRKDVEKSTFSKEISRLIEIGNQRLFVTPEDIRKIFPTTENNLEIMENVFEALRCADDRRHGSVRPGGAVVASV